MAVSDLLTQAAKSVASALPSFMMATGLGEPVIGRLTSAALNKILFAQGWQFAVEVDGMAGIEFFVKDITYGEYTIETEEKRIGANVFNMPVGRSAQPITMMVRDTNQGLIRQWFRECIRNVVNDDGTINLPGAYLMTLRVYRLEATAVPILDSEFTVIPTEMGAITQSKDQVTEFLTFPLSFVQWKTFGDYIPL
ncbi:phage tail protein [Nissabacter sp. SGAir0207]|uniref:phage tail protein n=1 Tax=Nissabacter sp. SGAir0207 TaxID=2126321 RepID=UPI0010CD5EB9|nr:phage tail protein [Nissabacter sp. SGAir0207]QCR38734.1 phage tail protein [Nissabacter sp. SGAir0207]